MLLQVNLFAPKNKARSGVNQEVVKEPSGHKVKLDTKFLEVEMKFHEYLTQYQKTNT